MASVQLQSTHLWSKLVDEVVTSQSQLTSVSKDDLNWLKAQILLNMSQISGDALYRFLILANRRSGCGQFALTFNNKLSKCVSSRSETELSNLMNARLQDIMPEVSSNTQLNTQQQELVLGNLKTEMLALNMTMDTLLSSSTIYPQNQSILGDSTHVQCYGNVCTHESKLTTSVNQMPTVVTVLTNDTGRIPIIYMFPLVQLITLIVMGGINPYTQAKFSHKTAAMITKRYPIEVCMVKYYLKLH
jgi:hypothetical protein